MNPLSFFSENWDWIQDNLIRVAGMFVIFTSLGYGLASILYRRTKDQLDATIRLQKSQLEAALAERDEHRERFQTLPGNTAFSTMGVAALSERARLVSSGIRSLLDAYEAKDRERGVRAHIERVRERRVREEGGLRNHKDMEESAQKAWEEDSLHSSESSQAVKRDYESRYEAEAVALRDELAKRLPLEDTKWSSGLYERVPNHFAIRETAAHLERLAVLVMKGKSP